MIWDHICKNTAQKDTAMTEAAQKDYEEFEVEIDQETYDALSVIAEERGMSVDDLASEIVTAEIQKEIEAAKKEQNDNA
jgi:hypothetical protein